MSYIDLTAMLSSESKQKISDAIEKKILEGIENFEITSADLNELIDIDWGCASDAILESVDFDRVAGVITEHLVHTMREKCSI